MRCPIFKPGSWITNLLGLLVIPTLVSAQHDPGAGALRLAQVETEGDNRREISVPAAEEDDGGPRISLIESPTPSCIQPDATRNACYINWYYHSVSSAPATGMTDMYLEIAQRRVAHHQGFFQNSFFVPYQMRGQGFRVDCGPLGAGGDPDLGNAYQWALRARDTNTQQAANFGTIRCPAFIP